MWRISWLSRLRRPWFMSLNGKTISQGKEGMNIRPTSMTIMPRFLVTVMKHFADEKNIRFGYAQPGERAAVDWNTPRQEGTYANNEDCYKLIRELNDEISRQGLDTKIVFGEAGAIKYLYGIDPNVPDTDNQICEFFSDKGAHPILEWKMSFREVGHPLEYLASGQHDR